MKKIVGRIGAAFTACALIAAGGTFISVKASDFSGNTQLKLAHNQQDGSEIADTIAKFSDFTEKDSGGDLSIKIYPSGQLGSETEEVEMVQAGILDMAKVSSNTLGQFDNRYAIFALPYLFTSQEHYYEAMEKSEAVKKLFESTADQGFIAIGYYANGSRNYYLKKDVCVDDPSDLQGMKIRSMVSTTSMGMIEAMGATPVPMSSSETYSALQQGIVDGAENTELALTVNGHEDLVSSYTYTEHQYSPDIYIISTKTWNSLSDDEKKALQKALSETNDNFKAVYNDMMDSAIEEAKEHGVNIYKDIDKTAFIEAVQPIHEEYKSQGNEYKALYDDIELYRS
ncbi:TRAP transporter substrate-binding protein [Oribacterium sp. P6A1]|uniref:TRAP transporter substrate-binding protein n=1 Tax=Oribacterium sp. P6A1 TaxID=1410612 RepID=UPI0005616B0C|nr:TRAP transporter substrate-binding protein [Oribacterium sp. P6A1]